MSAWIVISHQEFGSGSTSSILFSSIPQTYTDLYLAISHRNTGAESQARIRINGDTGTNYPKRWLTIDNGNISSYTDSERFPFWTQNSGQTANTFGNTSMYFSNYRVSSNKLMLTESVTENNASSVYSLLGIMQWSNTNAITSIELEMAAFSYAQYSSATLYGITAGSSNGVVVS